MKEEKKRRNAVARVLAAENKGEQIAAEAKRAGVHPRTIERWLEGNKEALAAAPSAGQAAVPSNATPPSEGGNTGENPALKAALDAAAEGAPGSDCPNKVPVTQNDIAAARVDAQQFCLDTVGNITQAIGSVIVTSRYSPPLRLSDKAVQDLLKLSALEDGVIRANVDTLYPILLKWMAGPYQLAGGLIFGQLLRYIGLDNLAKVSGWKEKAPAAATAPPPAHVFTARPAPQATAPPWTPPAEGIKTEDRSEGPFGQVKDAPSIPPAESGLFIPAA